MYIWNGYRVGVDHPHASWDHIPTDEIDANQWDGEPLIVCPTPVNDAVPIATFLEIDPVQWTAGPYASDVMIQTLSGRLMIEQRHVFIFRLDHPNQTNVLDRDMAANQLEEHAVGSLQYGTERWWFVQPHDDELAERIAIAYGCSIEPITIEE